MSFAVSMDGGAVEWCSDSVKTLKGPVYVKMIKDMLRFNASAAELLRVGFGGLVLWACLWGWIVGGFVLWRLWMVWLGLVRLVCVL
jgi:hypothetical protein